MLFVNSFLKFFELFVFYDLQIELFVVQYIYERVEISMNRLKQLRLEKGLLQSDIAKIINKTDRAVGQYERGERDPSSETWSIIANYFNVSLDYLLGNSNVRNPEDKIKQEFEFAYHKEMEGLTEEEIADALRFYKKIKYGKE